MPEAKHENIRSEIVLYKTEDGQARLDVVFRDETVWLTQDQMSGLFGKAKSTINEHIKNIYQEKELSVEDTMRKFGKTEFMAKPTNFYSLDVIISVGYRVKSHVATRFRIWATQRLKEYIIKGFVLDESFGMALFNLSLPLMATGHQAISSQLPIKYNAV